MKQMESWRSSPNLAGPGTLAIRLGLAGLIAEMCDVRANRNI